MTEVQQTAQGARHRPRRPPPRPTPERIRNHALFYLQRFAASQARLEAVLLRRAVKGARAHDLDPAEAAAMVRTVVADLARLGLVDDTRYAEGKARALAAAGRSPQRIAATLRGKGVAPELIAHALDHAAAEIAGDPALASAVVLARKRRLGPFGPGEGRAERRQRDLASLARAGFSYDIARRVIDAASAEEIEAALGVKD